MRRINYKGQEHLMHTRSGMSLLAAMQEQGIPAECDCDGVAQSSELCLVKWPKDTEHLLTAPTEFEQKVLGSRLAQGFRLGCQAIFK